MQESNSFAPRPCTLETFAAAGLTRGPAVLAWLQGTNTETGGFLRVIRQHGAEAVPLLSAHAISAGPLTREAYGTLLDELRARLNAAGPVDGVLLALHGAMLADGDDDPDGTTLRSLRDAAGQGGAVPVVATLDLHAHVTEGMVW